MEFITTNRTNNNKQIRSFPISQRTVNFFRKYGYWSVVSSLKGEDGSKHIDEDVAYYTFNQLCGLLVRDEDLACQQRTMLELQEINNFTAN